MNSKKHRPHHYAGEWYEGDGVRVEIERGKKSPNDIVVFIETRGRVMLTMPDVFRMLCPLLDAEEIARERPRYIGMLNFKGWKKLTDAIRNLGQYGCDVAIGEMEREKKQANLF